VIKADVGDVGGLKVNKSHIWISHFDHDQTDETEESYWLNVQQHH